MGKVLDKTQHSFTMITLMNLGIEVSYLNELKNIWDKPTVNNYSAGKLEAFPLKLDMK